MYIKIKIKSQWWILKSPVKIIHNRGIILVYLRFMHFGTTLGIFHSTSYGTYRTRNFLMKHVYKVSAEINFMCVQIMSQWRRWTKYVKICNLRTTVSITLTVQVDNVCCRLQIWYNLMSIIKDNEKQQQWATTFQRSSWVQHNQVIKKIYITYIYCFKHIDPN